MLRTLLHVVFAAVLCASAARGQTDDIARFAREFQQCFEHKDEKGLDKLLKSTQDMPFAAMTYFQELRVEVWGGKPELRPKVDMIKEAWARTFEGSPVLERLERWIESQDQRSFGVYRKTQGNMQKAWRYYTEETAKDNTKRKPFEESRDLLIEVARQMEQTGHKVEAAQAWNLVAICLFRIPEKSVQDRQDVVFALEQFLTLRDSWEWTGDTYYLLNKNTLKQQQAELDQKLADRDKRKSEGYGDNVRGVDALAMPGVAEVEVALGFGMLQDWEEDLDYCQRGGPVPAYWWSASFGQDQKDTKLSWFRRLELYMIRISNSKYGVSIAPSEEKRTQEVDVSGKGEASKFFIDADGKVPYAMFFWQGGDRERVGEAEVNLAPSIQNTPVYYRSAASWTAEVAGEPLTFYDDNTSGRPMDGDPFDGAFKMGSIGFAKDDERALAPLMDSMRVGKGPRVPFSEFVQIGDGWHHVHRTGDDKLGTRPLNPEYLRPGQVKLVWDGPKPTAPEQLVIAGRGDLRGAAFEVASGKEVTVPAGEYQVIWGRIVKGKGSRVQMGTIYAADSKPFKVEPGEVYELTMGKPFTIEFTRADADGKVEIDATRIWLKENSGCAISELQSMSVVPEVFVSKTADGKGAKSVAKFTKFTDSEMLNKASAKYPDIGLMVGCMPMPAGAKDGDMVLRFELPSPGMRVGLRMKKHPLFGKLDSEWK